MFGHVVKSFDLATPFTKDRAKHIFSLLVEHKFLVFPMQQLNPKQFSDFALVYGRQPIPVNKQGDVVQMYVSQGRKGVSEAKINGSDLWHSDNSFHERPAFVTSLYALEVPPEGGDTLFCDMQGIYASLPLSLQQEIESKFSSHQRYDKPESTRVRHPIVRIHPYSRVKSLYISPAYTISCEDCREEMLKELLRYCDNEQFQMRHKWQAGDVVIWDNAALNHKATTLEMDPSSMRKFWRISILGPRTDLVPT